MIPCNHPAIFDLARAVTSQASCDEVTALLAKYGLVISELSTHLEGQLIAVHPAHDAAFDGFAPEPVRCDNAKRMAWAIETVKKAAEAFAELARRWRPVLDEFDRHGVDVCFELHPGEDLHDGVTFERFLAAVDDHTRCNILFDPNHLLLHIDYLQFIDLYHPRIKAFHVKEAKYLTNGHSGVYGGYQRWIDRVGRFRSPGDG